MEQMISTLRDIHSDEGIRGVCKSATRHINRLYYDVRTCNSYNSDGINIFHEDWDNLIILDACRYDYFKQLNDMDGELEYRISRGSQSREFMRGNFQGQRA